MKKDRFPAVLPLTATCRLLFVLVIVPHEHGRIIHVAVTNHPTSAWTRNNSA